jgi:hypothetical protein
MRLAIRGRLAAAIGVDGGIVDRIPGLFGEAGNEGDAGVAGDVAEPGDDRAICRFGQSLRMSSPPP